MTDPMQSKVLILGGGYAGLMAAARIARGGIPVDITLVDARPSFTQRIRLHETLAGSIPKTLDYASLLGRRGVRFVQARVKALELERRRVLAWSPGGAPLELGYDFLVLALGSHTTAAVPGAAEHAVRLDDPEAVREAAGRLPALAASGGRALVVGGGLTGIEAAAELAERFPGLEVTLAARGRISDGYSAAGGAHLRRSLGRLGVELLEEAGAARLEAGRAWLEDGREIPFGLCVWAGGFGVPPLAREAGLAVDRSGRVLVDAALRSVSHPEVLAAGDLAAASFPDGRTIRMGCVSALPLGAHAGETVRRLLQGRAAVPFDFGITLRCVSLGRRDGLVQFTDWDDAPRPRAWTGRRAALVKELICRMTYEVCRNELRLGVRLYRWPRSGRPLLESVAGAAGRPAPQKQG